MEEFSDSIDTSNPSTSSNDGKLEYSVIEVLKNVEEEGHHSENIEELNLELEGENNTGSNRQVKHEGRSDFSDQLAGEIVNVLPPGITISAVVEPSVKKQPFDEIDELLGDEFSQTSNVSVACTSESIGIDANQVSLSIVDDAKNVEIVVEGVNVQDFQSLPNIGNIPGNINISRYIPEQKTILSGQDSYDEMKEIEAQMQMQPSHELKQEDDVNEQILMEDEHMIVGQITEMDVNMDVVEKMAPETSGLKLHNVTKLPQQGPPVSRIVQKPLMKHEVKFDESLFTELEDLVIHALDTISPFDAKFISEHIPTKRDEAQVEKRLTDHEFRKLSFSFQKLPILLFELLFSNEGITRSRALMLLTQNQLIQMRCKEQDTCNHGNGLEVIKVIYHQKSRFGINTGELLEFLITKIPNKYMPFLRLNKAKLEEFLEAGKITFHRVALSWGNQSNTNASFNRRDMTQANKNTVTLESIRQTGGEALKIDESGKLTMSRDHERSLFKIVKAVGKNKWEEATKLLLAVHEHEIDFDVEDTEIFSRIGGYYQLKLDPDLERGVFTLDEDKCIIYLYKTWHKVMSDESMWRQIGRHLPGRSSNQVKNRFIRTNSSPHDLTLENIKKFTEDPSNPATYNNDMAHVYALTIVPKNPEGNKIHQEVTAKLQHEVRFIVCGTLKEIFLLPCKETAVRCTHVGMVHTNFTYDPSRPAQQFVTFIKLTFSNGLKKAGLIEDPEEFHFSTINYDGEDIHTLMRRAEDERFIVPKDVFMSLNRRQEGLVEGRDGSVLPLKRKYVGPARPRGRPPGSFNARPRLMAPFQRMMRPPIPRPGMPRPMMRGGVRPMMRPGVRPMQARPSAPKSPNNPQDPDYRPSHPSTPKRIFRTTDGLIGTS